MNFRERVYKALELVPEGSVTTYGEIAKYLGSPGSARAVGTALRQNPTPGVLPCHRVVPATLRIGKYFGQDDPKKRGLLESEGVTFRGDQVNVKHLIKLG